MADLIPIVLAFDLRTRPASIKENPCSVDANMWPPIDGSVKELLRGSAASLLKREKASLVSPLDMSLFNCLPRTWIETDNGIPKDVVVTAFASLTIGPSRRAYRVDLLDGYYGCDVSYSDLKAAGWISLGYDVCDDSLSASLIYSGDGSVVEIAAIYPALPGALNAFGLFSTDKAATKFSTACGHLIAEHAPFSAVEVLIARYCAPMTNDNESNEHGWN